MRAAVQSAAIGYGIVLPFAVYLNDYLAVQYPLADGAPARQQKLAREALAGRSPRRQPSCSKSKLRCCAGVNGSMEKMHNIGWFILAYVAFLLVGRVVDAVRTVVERLSPLLDCRTHRPRARFARSDGRDCAGLAQHVRNALGVQRRDGSRRVWNRH